MLGQLELRPFELEVPDYHVRVVPLLSRRQQVPLVRHRQARDLVVVLAQERLLRLVLQVAHHHAAPRDVNEVLTVRMEENRTRYLRTMTDRVFKLNYAHLN